jgi:hypothetical protein
MTLEDMERRIEEVERVHGKGGPCDQSVTRIWTGIEDVSKRVTQLEIKLYILGAAVSIVGPLLAQFIGKKIGL